MQFQLLTLAALACRHVSGIDSGTKLSDVLEAGQLQSFSNMINAAGLSSYLQNKNDLTIIAPTNDAFSALNNSLNGNKTRINEVISYHVLNGIYYSVNVPGGSGVIAQTITGSAVNIVKDGDLIFYSADRIPSYNTQLIEYNHGVVYIVQHVMMPPYSVSETASDVGLTALVGALIEANGVDSVNTASSITVFAPNNQAFRNVGSTVITNSSDFLANLLNYHIIPNTVAYSTNLTNAQSIKTVNGQNVVITIEADGGVFVNDARILVADIPVVNGVIHIIDQVLNPSDVATPEASATQGYPAFGAATSLVTDFLTSAVPTPTTTVSLMSSPAFTIAISTSSSSSFRGAAVPMQTAGVGVAALFGAGAAVMMV